ncbi:hypothetical protein [Chitinophaga cymbidii]|uniref:Uncharacterized protein n=1 Tax=Chitinophaga cymbidii TaxID=1096750 RepID=A0A512RQ08_9BACT|nr:hypothetical protein [Chitinophaga cymbidii]GEP97779.1 hypothetical protein CCY01nite_40390 [Chitinophaga cymbidii]
MKGYVIRIFIVLCTPVFGFSSSKTTFNTVKKDCFLLVAGGDANDPSDYTWTASALNCPGTGRICMIVISSSDVYTLPEAIEAGSDKWVGRPKVNQTALAEDLSNAAKSVSDPYTAPSGRIFYKEH